MNNSIIHLIGKSAFWLSFVAGNICLFGYILSKSGNFALAGYFLLYIASLINVVIIFSLLIYGIYRKERIQECSNAILIMLINIPIAALYTCIGLEIL